ncbi:MAG: TetR/AcrR family transcriptional regulator [Microthrixaceae bacterium]
MAPDDTRHRIIRAAAEVFGRFGFDRVSLDEVSSTAGVHRTTPHRTFPGGRDELVAAVLEHEVEVLATGALALIDAAPTQTEAFLDAITHAVEIGRRSQVVGAVLADPGFRPTALAVAADRLRSASEALWQAILAAGERRPATVACARARRRSRAPSNSSTESRRIRSRYAHRGLRGITRRPAADQPTSESIQPPIRDASRRSGDPSKAKEIFGQYSSESQVA